MSVRVGVDTAGHYHRTIVSRLVVAGHDVVELNPAHVKAVRAQQGAGRLKTDLRNAAAIVDLLISGGGRAPQQRDAALVEQLVWAGLRRRRILARTALTHQLLGTLDLVSPGLDGCSADLLGTRLGRSSCTRWPTLTGCTASASPDCEGSSPATASGLMAAKAA